LPDRETVDQERRNKEVDAKGEKLKERLAEEKLSATGAEAETTDRIMEQLEEKRDLTRVIALIDAGEF
jgi:regulator of replication initiation timing